MNKLKKSTLALKRLLDHVDMSSSLKEALETEINNPEVFRIKKRREERVEYDEEERSKELEVHSESGFCEVSEISEISESEIEEHSSESER